MESNATTSFPARPPAFSGPFHTMASASSTQTKALVDAPIEIWLTIFGSLQRKDKKQCRLVCSAWESIATPLCFEAINFDMSEMSIMNLAHIASNDKLARHVRALVLSRRKGRFRTFDYEAWESSIDLPDDPQPSIYFSPEKNESDSKRNLISYHDWSQLPLDDKESLFNQYELDRVSSNDSVQKLARHLRFLRVGSDFMKRAHPVDSAPPTTEENLMRRLCHALTKFTRLRNFKHNAAVYLQDRWVIYWRRLRLSAYNFSIDYQSNHYEDTDIDALHLSCALLAIGWAKLYLPELRSTTMYIEGPAFWGLRRLRRLWLGSGHGEVRKLRQIYDDAFEAEADAELDPVDHSRDEECTRQLVLMESAMTGLTHLDISVCEDEDNGGLYLAARPLLEFLCRGQNLEVVRLAFGGFVDGVIQPDNPTRERGNGPQELLTLLTHYTPWSKITELCLEISTEEVTLLQFLCSIKQTLRRLTFSNVSLVVGDWESVLPAIASILIYLEQLDLSKLCDDTEGRGHRALFDMNADYWLGKKGCYSEYKKTTIDRLLLSQELSTLEPELFLFDHLPVCSHN
jgi:hypothetical protein